MTPKLLGDVQKVNLPVKSVYKKKTGEYLKQ